MPNNQIDQLNDILKGFQSCLLKSVDDRLSAVDIKLSDAISQFNNDNRIKTFSEVAAQAAKNVENTAKNNINNVENVAKQSIDVVNSRSVIENIVENARDNGSNISSSNTLINVPTSEVFLSNETVFNHS